MDMVSSVCEIPQELVLPLDFSEPLLRLSYKCVRFSCDQRSAKHPDLTLGGA